jgi:xyloglucan-specific exo-beta-1,4-glucanase
MLKNNKKIIMICIMSMALTAKMSFTHIVKAAVITNPTNQSQVYNWNNVAIGGGGFIPNIIFNPSEKNLVYARTDMGGAYRWDTTTNSWKCITDWISAADWNYMGCDSLASDSVDPNRVYIAAGCYTSDWVNQNGAILRSADRGNTWQKYTLPFKVGGNEDGRGMGERLAVDPNDDSILYMAASRGNGLWKSTNYGKSWSKVTSFPTGGDFVDQWCGDIGLVWVTFDKNSAATKADNVKHIRGSASQTIYVGLADSKHSIYRSTDGGQTWAPIPGEPTKVTYTKTVNGSKVSETDSIFPHHSILASNGMLYVSYSNGVGPYDGSEGQVWKYDTNKDTWTNISPTDSSNGDSSYWGYGGLGVDAQHPDTVMVSTINEWYPDGNIYRSTNGGATWKAAWSTAWDNTAKAMVRTNSYNLDYSVSPWLDWGNEATAPSVVTSPKLGWMMDSVVIDPFNSDHMMYGTGATLYATNDLTNWDKKGSKFDIAPNVKGLEETAVTDLISPPSGAHLFSSILDIGGFKHDDLSVAPEMPKTPVIGSNSSEDYAELNPSVIVRVGGAEDGSKCPELAYSSDGGNTWSTGKIANTDGNGSGIVSVSANGKTIVWSETASTAKVCYSTDNGKTWIASNGVPAQSEVRSDRVNSNKFYAFSGGNFYVSTDGGANFTNTGATGLPAKSSVNFKAVPGIEGDVWIAGGSDSEGVYGVWHSTDSGKTFTKLSNVQKADVIGFGKAAPGQNYMALYISGEVNGVIGIFRSDDEGKTWIRINDDNHQYGATNFAITGDPRIYGRVYLATNGRGIIYGDIPTGQ